MIRRREWSRVFEGVYVDHTGPRTWRQRAWAATLLHEPAALDGLSALHAAGFGRPPWTDDIELVVAAQRRVTDVPGIRTRRTRAWASLTQGHLSPPRVRLESAALTAASRAGSDDEAIALLGDLLQQRRTTTERLGSALADLTRLPRRRLLAEVLSDVSSGAMSALERRYLRDVERAHHLPRGRRQRRVAPAGRLQVRDVDYPDLGVDVELDGRLGHELWRDRWDDRDRDLRSLADGTVTVRLGWGQVLQPCRVAGQIGAILSARGWDDRPKPCRRECPVT